jgi:pimeloyl-ACP methyl ester carboxylesterase
MMLTAVPKQTINADDSEGIAVWDTGGTGTPIVFIHGFPESHLCWTHVLSHLKNSEAFRIIAYDLRGHGESSKRGEASWRRFVKDHLEIIKTLELTRYHLVGHDWGGAVALHISRLVPETLNSLTILNTNFWRTDIKGMWHLTFLNLPVIAPLAFKMFPEKIYRLFLENTFLNPSAVGPDQRQEYRKSFHDPDTTNYWIKLYKSMARAMVARSAPKRFKNTIVGSKVELPPSSAEAFRVPTQLIWGKQDTFNPLWVGRDIETRLNRAGAVVHFNEIEGAGHFVMEEQPALVAEVLEAHLVRNGADP